MTETINGIRMLWSYFLIPKMVRYTTQSKEHPLRAVDLVPFPLFRDAQDVNCYRFFPRGTVMFMFPVVCCFVLPVAHLLFREVKKRCYRPISWISLYMCGEEICHGCVSLKSGHLSEKWLFCVATFVALSVLSSLPVARAPLLLSPATLHGLQLDQIFGFSSVFLEICVHWTKTSMKPQDRYLKLFKTFCRIFMFFLALALPVTLYITNILSLC